MYKIAKYDIGENYIETIGGGQFFFNKPTIEQIDINVIAHALSNLCRFGGHCKDFYSVAEHCYHLALYLKHQGASKKESLTMLLHDAGEAYLVDIPRPIKAILSQYKTLETTIDSTVFKRFDLEYPMPKWVKELDARMLKTERDAFMKSTNVWSVDILEPLKGIEFKFYSPNFIKRKYLELFKELTNV